MKKIFATKMIIFCATALLLSGCNSSAPKIAAPSPSGLFIQINMLLHSGRLLPGSYPYMYGARLADFYTLDRASDNAVAAASAGVQHVKCFPSGSLLIKENFDSEKHLKSVTAMLKVPGYDSEDNDWLMAAYKPDGTPVAFGKVSACINCHSVVRHSDLVFPPLQHLPPEMVRYFFPGQELSPKYLAFFPNDHRERP